MDALRQRALLERLERANQFARRGEVLQAELSYVAILKEQPGHKEASLRLAELALRRGDAARSVSVLQVAVRLNADDVTLRIDLAGSQARAGQRASAIETLEAAVADLPDAHEAGLWLGALRRADGDAAGALKAWFRAVTGAQRAGFWKDTDTTPPRLHDMVALASETVRTGHRELFFGAFDGLRQTHGAHELVRVERALTGYLREWDSTPADPRQRAKFLFFPGLPEGPYHDPLLQPWAPQLQAAFPQIRAEALRVLDEDQRLANFIPDDLKLEDHVDGDAAAPSWEAFFFYRHGQRFDANHRRCPATSAVLESLPLCRIADQAPEILYSVLRPGSHIKPHHGVSNVRLVMHLPLVVPGGCALNMVDRGEHVWREGQLVMFDDTYLHEAWNRSAQTRVVLLMDCWNPHLSAVEQAAIGQLIDTITGLRAADRSRAATDAG